MVKNSFVKGELSVHYFNFPPDLRDYERETFWDRDDNGKKLIMQDKHFAYSQHMYRFALYYILLYDFNKLSKNYDNSKALNLGKAYLHAEKHLVLTAAFRR